MSYHMSAEEFRRLGYQFIDWIAEYHEKVESYPVMSKVEPGEIRRRLPKDPPQKGQSLDRVLNEINEIILPGITHWQSPNFFAFFPSNVSGPSILGELLSAGLGVQGMLWATSPAATELETHVLDWIAEMLGLPQKFRSENKGGGVIHDTASSATLVALLAAREKASGFECNRKGAKQALVAYTSAQGHSSIEKAMRIAGLGSEHLRSIAVDQNYAMDAEALAEQIRKDRREGYIPCFVTATVGTTSSNAMDPLKAIGRVCREEKIWLHVDAAMSGTAALCPEFRHLLHGLEMADSYCFNPHKWMFTNFDTDCFYVADRRHLIQTLSILPEYLRNKATESGAVFDYRDWQIPLGRRFRALKLWFVLRHYGLEGLQHHIRRHVELAQQFAEWVRSSEDFDLMAPVPLNLVTFRHKNGDDFNRRLEEALNQSGKMYLTHTVLDGQYALRLSVGQTHTEERHVRDAWQLIQETAKRWSSGV